MNLLLPFPSTDPGAVGPIAGRYGNTYSVRVAADQERDAGRNDRAAALDLLAGEYDVRAAQARQLRARLDAMPDPLPVIDDGERPQLTDLRTFANRNGLPLEPSQLSRCKAVPLAFVLFAPSDGERNEETADRLVALFRRAFPGAVFLVCVRNIPKSDAGRAAEALLDELTDNAPMASGRAAA